MTLPNTLLNSHNNNTGNSNNIINNKSRDRNQNLNTHIDVSKIGQRNIKSSIIKKKDSMNTVINTHKYYDRNCQYKDHNISLHLSFREYMNKKLISFGDMSGCSRFESLKCLYQAAIRTIWHKESIDSRIDNTILYIIQGEFINQFT